MLFWRLVDFNAPVQDLMKRKTPPTKTYKRPAKRTKTIGPSYSAAMKTLAHEIGYFDAAIATDATTTPTIIDLNNMASGDDNTTRDGNKIGMIALGLRITFENESIAANTRTRYVVVLDPQSNAVAPVWTDVFTAATIESQRKIGTLSRYKILMDKTVTCNATTSTAGAFQKGFFKKYIKMPNNIAAYTSGAAAVPWTNSLSLMYISDIAAGVADQNVVGTSRLFFNR